jgi:hypothetical protein
VTGSPIARPVGDVTSGGADLKVAMFMDDLFRVPDCILINFTNLLIYDQNVLKPFLQNEQILGVIS